MKYLAMLVMLGLLFWPGYYLFFSVLAGAGNK